MTDPANICQRFGPPGYSCPNAPTSLRVGGRYRIEMINDKESKPFYSNRIYTEIARPTRLVFTWSWEQTSHDGGDSLVSIDLSEAEGKTCLSLRHEGLPD